MSKILTRDGALGAVGASAERYALVARIPGMTGNRWSTIPGRATPAIPLSCPLQ